MNAIDFQLKYGYRGCGKCCGNCKWGDGIDYDGGTDCFHPLLQQEEEGNDRSGLHKKLYEENRGWCMNAYPICVCDNWEKRENESVSAPLDVLCGTRKIEYVIGELKSVDPSELDEC